MDLILGTSFPNYARCFLKLFPMTLSTSWSKHVPLL